MNQTPYIFKVNKHRVCNISIKEQDDGLSSNFPMKFKATLAALASTEAKAIVLRVAEEYSDFVPLAIKEGMSFLSVSNSDLLLMMKLKECSMPPPATHAIGGGALTLSPDLKKILVVKEKNGPLKHLWKIPTGRLDPGESIQAGILRELSEELDLRVKFVGLLAVRDVFPMIYDLNELFFTAVVIAESEEFKRCPIELADAKWMNLDDYKELNYSHNTFKVSLAYFEKFSNVQNQEELKRTVAMTSEPIKMIVDSNLKKFSEEYRPLSFYR